MSHLNFFCHNEIYTICHFKFEKIKLMILKLLKTVLYWISAQIFSYFIGV